MATLETAEKIVGLLIGLGTIGTAAYLKIIKPMRLVAKNKRQEVYNMVHAIHKELNYNGGSSIKDAVARLEKTNVQILTRLGELEESQKVVLNIQGQAFWLSDNQGETNYVSPALCKVYGHGESDIMGNGWVSWIIDDGENDRESIFAKWNFSVENRTVFDERYTVKRSDGLKQKVMSLCFHKVVNNAHAGSIGKVEPIGEPFNN